MFNVCSLRNKFSDLEALAASNDFHIIGLSESYISTENRDFLAEYNLPNYSMFSCNWQNKKGGGVLIYGNVNFHSTTLQTEKVDNVNIIFS